jgi:hypothetical protein
MPIVAMTGLSQPTVRATIDLFDVDGWARIRPALRGRNTGDGRVLSQTQEDVIERMIIDKRPEQLKMDLSLWTSTFGVKLRWVNSLNRNLKWCLVNGRSCKYPLQGILPLSQIKVMAGSTKVHNVKYLAEKCSIWLPMFNVWIEEMWPAIQPASGASCFSNTKAMA